MKNNSIKLLEPTPEFKSKKCKIALFGLRLVLEYTTFVTGALVWYFYDYFFALAALVLAFIVMGIIRSYMRNNSIPASQREYHYNDKAIAAWYLSQNLCFEEKNEH